MANFWKIVNNVIKKADVLLLVIDPRFVEETRNTEIEDKIHKLGKPLIYVVTKCDIVGKEKAEQQAKNFKPAVFISSKEHFGTTLLRNAILIEAKRAKIFSKSILVGVLGYPNVGKSSLINSMSGRRSAPTSSTSGFTKGVQKIRSDSRIMFLDTPGVIPYLDKNEEIHACINTIDSNKATDPDLVVLSIMKRFPGVIESHYGIKINDDAEETLEEIAKMRNMVKKGGKPDIVKIARLILKDWQAGNIKM